MRIFLFEFITGGGMLARPEVEFRSESLYREGAAMVTALAEDFRRMDGLELTALRDHRLSSLQLPGCRVAAVRSRDEMDDRFSRLAAQADWTVVIAPETDGQLLALARRAEATGGRLLSPSSEIVALAGDKQDCCEHLYAAGVPVPRGMTISNGREPPPDFPFPAVVKPGDGAGSIGVRHVSNGDELRDVADGSSPWRLERYHRGIPASVAFLCGATVTISLPPCRQRLSKAGDFRYLGGELPLPRTLALRATRLAKAAVKSLPSTIGFLGVDLVLDAAATSVEDVVIEINPRLTTSYVGLRAASRNNLAAAMLAIAAGRSVELSFTTDHVEFDADGHVRLKP